MTRRQADGEHPHQQDFRTLAEHAPDLIVRFDRDLRHLYVNPAVERATGIPRDQYQGKTNRELGMPGELVAHWEEGLRRVFETEQEETLEFAFPTPDGLRYYESRVVPERDADGTVSSVLGVTRDVTERKQAEEIIAVRMRQRSVLAELGRLGLTDISIQELMEEVVVQAAGALDVEYCKVLELQPDQQALLLKSGIGWREGLVGRATVGTGLDSQAGYTLVSSGPVTVENLRKETRFTGPPLLHEHGVVSGMSVIIGNQDRPYGVLGAHTRRRRSFTEDDVNFLQALAHILAAAVERQRLDRLRSEFLGMVTHELRSPLAAITAAVSIMREEEPPNPATEELLGAIDSQTNRLLDLVGNLLDMAQIEAGAFAIDPAQAELPPVLREAVQAFSKTNSVQIEASIPERLPRLNMDQGRIAQVMQNLLSNAARHAEAGTAITVTAEQAGDSVRVAVCNRGPLIPASQLPLLFKKFSRLEDEQGKRSPGAGLGLAICKGIVEGHRGKVWAENHESRGEVCFIFTLPVGESEAS